MTQERADEIIRKVFYANFDIFPTTIVIAEEKDFHFGRMVGEMQKTLEIELAKEVEQERSEKNVRR